MSDRLLTTREVAAFLGVSPETVLRRWRAGALPGYRLASNVLRFRESEAELSARSTGSHRDSTRRSSFRRRVEAARSQPLARA